MNAGSQELLIGLPANGFFPEAAAASTSSNGGVGGNSKFLPQVQGGEGGGGYITWWWEDVLSHAKYIVYALYCIQYTIHNIQDT